LSCNGRNESTASFRIIALPGILMTDTSTHTPFKPQRALISVSDKTQLIPLAQALRANQVELIATGNTALLLKEQGIAVTEVSDYTGFPELLNGRVKTLHPLIHAGLLARTSDDDKTLESYGIKPIDLLIVNLYPFEKTISDYDCDFSNAIEQIDIGGPCMIRAAAKNHHRVYVIVSPDDYNEVIRCLDAKQSSHNWSFSLAQKAFAHTAAYDAAISNYLSALGPDYKPQGFPATLTYQVHQLSELRYGENPHQQAIFYADKTPQAGSLASAILIQGKQLSYNNLLDADAALDCIQSFPESKPTCVIIKHNTPCAIAYGTTLVHAYLKAFKSDPISAYGGIIAVNQRLDLSTVTAITEQQFVELIIAPELTEEAKQVIKIKPNIRVLITNKPGLMQKYQLDLKKVSGGLLVQEHDIEPMPSNELNTVSQKKATTFQMDDLLFAWRCVQYVKSNAIVYAKEGATIGIGGGQTSRVMSARIGLWQAEQMGFETHGAVMASDAFIPFPDTIELAAKAGISALIQPGGSIRDKQIIECANSLGLIMVFTGIRHFKH
jgi:phosphoribosylaminoimidazolecarboxamide formyltransferase/IMP cyclohydrolase